MDYAHQQLKREKVFRDPVHNYVYVKYQVILDLINTSEFQRLRRVHQLGTTSLIFHGAEHSRFSHSVGVYEIARRIIESFQKNFMSKEPGDGLWDDSEKLVTLCAALLHDVGHGAYSHTFEHIFGTNHEQITQAIITSPTTEINQVLRRVSPDFPEKVASVINKTYPNKQVVEMISSQLDADRMDYLLRDAYNTGVKYGTFDLSRILEVMRPYKDGICFEMSGMHAVEDYIVSRFQMYQQVYFHPVSRSMEVVLNRLLQRAKVIFSSEVNHDPQTPYLLLPFFKGDFNLDDYLQLDDGVLNTYFIHWKRYPDDILSNLASRFIDRKPLKSVKFDKSTSNLLPRLRQIIEQSGFNPDYYTATDNSFDLPYDAYQADKKQIHLMQDDGTLVSLSSVSPLVRAISDRQTGDNRFFFPREILKPDENVDLFQPEYDEFNRHIRNDQLIQ
ncbi:HD domain-containing protein [Lentilactobacillus otakiensis]|uniref:Metal dependent phosphohydrolase n=1 Tax=Lentilactobacillus otakiensis DSM 19908 = JCM 15040 TaxID=1423780 RepID=S4NJP1_9LACO|nr:HD domain-containing protein [Lentilactobacillus otakiensis]KRL11828.1 metal dependent phosphohydrolase [Lentilactobacillus otakiensis DSM 19908 = JCM 15040]MBZ3776051.1 HD domain-containing protein [Lentilactobacillus otakiensis]MDV3519168.1 HD domain-containing protein [Lentilactobacillus otakiensis]GAD17527.1 metal dependent phosphohydrolase [Lentilactobacillus otakiensis DSM 19908 = JCM 15040]